MAVVGIVGYVETPQGLRALTTAWADHLSEDVKRRFVKTWFKSKQKMFSKYAKKVEESGELTRRLELIKKNCQVVRVIAHTQPSKMGHMRMRKAHIAEIQINGGSVADKVAHAVALFESDALKVSEVFSQNELIDVIGVTKGHGFEGVTTRWGVTRLPRKTHKGLRKVACIGAWHPARVSYTVARAGQRGYHHRSDMNKKVYRLGAAGDASSASTESDLTVKDINPMGGFPHYGWIRNDWIMLKGTVMGAKKRPITLRKALHPATDLAAKEEIKLTFIDTSSKFGHGRFQTSEEKRKVLGRTKAQAEAEADALAAAE